MYLNGSCCLTAFKKKKKKKLHGLKLAALKNAGDNGRKHFPLFLYLMLTVHALSGCVLWKPRRQTSFSYPHII